MPTLVVENSLSGADLGLNFGLTDLLIYDAGTRRVLYALSRTENKLIEFEVGTDGSLSFSSDLELMGVFEVGSDPTLCAITDSSGTQSLAVGGLSATSGQNVTLEADGALGTQRAIESMGEVVAPVHAQLSIYQALVTGRPSSGGLDLFTDTGAGFTYSAGLDDTEDRYLADIAASVSFQIDATSYVVTASATEDGLNLVQVSPTLLTQRDALGVSEGLAFNTPTQLEVITRPDETLVVAGAFDTSSLSVVRVDAAGVFEIADHVLDAPWTCFQSISALETAVFGDFAFVGVGGGEGGVTLFTVLPGGRLVHLDSLADAASTTLYRVSSIEMAITGDQLSIFVSSAWEPGLTWIGYDLSNLGAVMVADRGSSLVGTADDDQLIGSELSDTLAGGDGNDILLDGAGSDVLIGGDGADLFVMHPDGVVDEITDFDSAEDRLDLSAFDFLHDVSQLQVTPVADGAVIVHGAETILLRTSDAAPLTQTDLTNEMILNVDRPPLVASAQELIGDIGADILNGGAGRDTIFGGGGDDVLTGQGGEDTIAGGDGDDTLDGGRGRDTLLGEAGADFLVGGLDGDLLHGGIGDDVIYGDEYSWSGA